MTGRFLPFAALALLFAGPANADAPDPQADASPVAVAKQEAPAPSADDATEQAPLAPKPDAVDQELHPDARPVYLNGGHFGGN